jgi:hypothetical protein
MRYLAGVIYVPINLSAIASGTGGFIINGENFIDNSGYSVSTAGDVNGDGLAEDNIRFTCVYSTA